MKKLIFLLLASFLVISACGQKEESKSEETKKATEDKKEKDNKKKDKEKPDKNAENEESAENQQQDTTNQEDENQQQEVQQSNAQQQIDEQTNQQADDQQPLTQEQMEANAKVAKQHGYTGIPNGDAGMIDYDEVDRILEENRQKQQAHDNWVNDQNEWNNASEEEKEQIRKNNAEKYGYEYNPEDYEE